MVGSAEETPWVPDVRRAPATAIGGVRPRHGETLPPQRRPFTSMGASLFDLDAARSSSPRASQLQPVKVSSSLRQSERSATTGEFDVRKFLLDQKGNEPLHTTALFRGTIVEGTGEDSSGGGSSRKKKLPRMDQPRTARSSNQLAPSASSAQLEDTVSHFYTIEKLSESCFHAEQSKHTKTWHFLPGAEERSKSCSGASANASSGGANSLTNLERPSRRVDVLDLEKCFDIAMQYVQKATRSEIGTSTDPQFATIERDVMTIQAKVVHRYESLVARNGQDRAGVDDVGAKGPPSDDQKGLARTLFEQKWSDVILGEIEAMLTKSFLEQGSLLRKTRERYAKAFFKLERLYSRSTKELSNALEGLHQTREQLRLASESHALDTQQMKNQYEEEIKRLSVGFESRREEMERKMADSKDQMMKMGDTMKTLNTIFRQMREDTDKVKAVELRENFIKLEKKYDTCKEEVERLRPYVQLNQQLHEQKEAVTNENQALKEKIASFDPIIASKDEMITNLMEQQSELIAAEELRVAQDDERRRLEAQAAEDEEEEGYDEDRDDESGTAQSRRPTGRSRGIGSAAVCVRCKENLRTQSQVGGLAMASSGISSAGQADESDAMGLLEPKRKRVQCMYFRILLPNLRGRRPQREVSWTLSCMRSILFAKQLDDTMCRRSGGAFPLRIRMPEFVYSWFSPWRSLRDEKAVQNSDGDPFGEEDMDGRKDSTGRRAALNGANKERTEEQRQLQADEDRWCLYYGVKSLVQEGYLEAKLFLSLLDEKYGEDEQVFMLYCYRVIDVLLGGKVNWGPLRDYVSYEQFSTQYDKEFGGRQSSSDLLKTIHSAVRVPKTIWISPYHASLATSIVLGKATDTERAALDKKLMAFAVTNLPEQERPSIYLTPANASSVHWDVQPGEKPTIHQQQNDAGTRENATNTQQLQFVDANLWVELMMMEYKEEQAHRRAAIRLMFQTATSASSIIAGSLGIRSSIAANASSTMDMEQFRIMIRTLNDEIPSFMIAALFRAAFMRGNGSVSFDSFLEAAEYAQFFSSCMRLENPVASMARLAAEGGQNAPHAPAHAALSTSTRAAFLVDKYFTLLHKQLETMVAELPIWSRSLADTLMFELSSALVDENGRSSGGGALSDGVYLLTSFHRLLKTLLMSSLVKKDCTGIILSSKSIFSFEKAIQAVLDCVRLGEKTTIEQLIDTVRQNLSVKRVQLLFRKHLQRDMGVPLVMRPLFHPSYANQRSKLSARRAERPVKWVHYVIYDVLRRCLRSETTQTLLLELSLVSSVLLQCGKSTRSASTCELNGGIGQAPKPLIVEMLYDSFVERFGTRCEAEKLLHDVFVNCRSMVGDSQLVLLFSYLCCMSDASPDDRLMGQNEALSFLLAVFRCGLHPFHVVQPLSAPAGGLTDGDAPAKHEDLISQSAAEGILFAAFTKLGADQKQRMKMRLEEQLTIWKTPGLADMPASMMSGSFALRSAVDLSPKQFMAAESFLVLALNEWKRYIQHRMNEVRVICCSMEDDIAHAGSSLPLDMIATMLQKADISFNNDELSAVFRRVCLTEQPENQEASTTKGEQSAIPSFSTSKHKGSLSSQEQSRPVDHTSDRLAAACYPLLARETLVELRRLEHASPVPFKLLNAVDDKARFLVETWRAYDVPCRLLLDELRRIGKNNDIQAEAVSRRAPMKGGRSVQREVLYLSSSTSSDTLSSQDVAQLEALHNLFLERLDKMTDELNKPPQQADTNASRRTSMKIMNDLASTRRMSVHAASPAALLLTDETKEALANSRALVVNETWKIFRQLLVTFSRLRTLAGLGDGPLPDKWDAPADYASAPVTA